MVLEDVPLLTGGRLQLRYVEQSDSQIWPYYVFTNYSPPPDDHNPVLRLRNAAVGYGLNWGDLATFPRLLNLLVSNGVSIGRGRFEIA